MALQIDSEFHGITVADAYCTVGSIGFNSDNKTEVMFTLYRRAAKGVEPFTGEPHRGHYDIDGGDPWAQAYAHLKTMPEFEGAVDC